MFKKSINLNWLLPGVSQTFLEHIMCTEYLLAKGYLMSELEKLPSQVAKKLVAEACRFAARRLSGFGFIERYQFRLLFSLS